MNEFIYLDEASHLSGPTGFLLALIVLSDY